MYLWRSDNKAMRVTAPGSFEHKMVSDSSFIWHALISSRHWYVFRLPTRLLFHSISSKHKAPVVFVCHMSDKQTR